MNQPLHSKYKVKFLVPSGLAILRKWLSSSDPGFPCNNPMWILSH